MEEEPRIKQFLSHQAAFMGYLLAMTRDLDAAEEIFQNVAVIMMDQAAGEKPRDFFAWAREVLRRQALYYLREKRRDSRRFKSIDPALLEGISRSFMEDPTGKDHSKRELKALGQCVQRLPVKSRRILARRYQQGETFELIGQAIKMTAAAVQRALSRMRKTLHDCVRISLTRTGEI